MMVNPSGCIVKNEGMVLKIDTLIFDLDGVITTEEKYWACARLTLWELVTKTLDLPEAFGDAPKHEEERATICPNELIYALKGRAVNSNWDIAYLMSCVYMAAMPNVWVPAPADLDSLLRQARGSRTGPAAWPEALEFFLSSTHGAKGRALVQEAGTRLMAALRCESPDLLRVDGPFWSYLFERFQRFYRGEAMAENGAPPLLDGTVLDDALIDVALKRLHDTGYSLGIASGRPRDEMNDALGHLDLLKYFDPKRLGTLDVIRQAEVELKADGLSKPHPLSLMRALYPEADLAALMDENFQKVRRPNVVMVGDATSDILMARACGCRSVGVLTGVNGTTAKEERKLLLIHAGCEAILEDITELPDWLEGQSEQAG